MEPEDFDGCDCPDHDDYEADMDFLLAQQELEDFEQADEYFDHWGGDYFDDGHFDQF
jgi:hypothetical protein